MSLPLPSTTAGPAISIITVAWNDRANLQRTLENLFALPYGENLEFIVVDGASTDGTAEWLATLTDPRLRWSSARDKGLYDAMNKGIERASKPWLWFINAGDTVQPALLSPTLTDSTRALIFVPVLDNGRLVQKRRPAWQIPYCHQGTLFRRDPAIRYDIRRKIAGDYLYILEYLKKYALKIQDIPIAPSTGAVVADLNGVSRQNRIARDLDAAKVSFGHFGLCSNLLFFPPLLVYQSIRRLLGRR